MSCFSGLCEELGCKLTNFRNRWSSYNEKKKRGVFTVWADRLDRGSGRYVFIEADADDPRAGAMEAARTKKQRSRVLLNRSRQGALRRRTELATEIYKRRRTVVDLLDPGRTFNERSAIMVDQKQVVARDVTRKDIIDKFVTEVKLTKAGASTYYQMIEDKHEPMGKK